MKRVVVLVLITVSWSFSQTQQQRFTKVESNLSADELYAKGRDLFTQAATAGDARERAENLKQAVKYFEESVSKDPEYLQGYLALLQCYTSMTGFGTTNSAGAFAKLKTAAAKAVELNESLPEPHQLLAWAKYQYDWDWDGAEQEFKRALDLNPEFAELWPRYASFLAAQGKFKDAMLEINRMSRYNTDRGWSNFSLGYIFYWTREYDSAITHYKVAVAAQPKSWQFHFYLGLAYVQKSRYDEGIEELRSAVILSVRNATAIAGLGYGLGLAGKRHEALSTLEELEKTWSSSRPVPGSMAPAYRIAAIYAALGEKEQTLEWLEKGLEGKNPWMLWLMVDAAFDSLHKERRFISLLKEIGVWQRQERH